MTEIVVNEKKNDVNMFKFTGIMIYRKESPRCLTVTLRTTTAHGRTFTNSMVLLSFEKELNALVNSIPLRTKVRVTGYVASRKNKPAAEPEKAESAAGPARRVAEPENVQYFVLTGIEKVDDSAADENMIEIIGSVSRAFVTRSGSITFIIGTVREGHYLKMIKATASPKLGVDFLQLMAASTKVHIFGHCSGHSYMEDGEIKYLESIVIDSITHA